MNKHFVKLHEITNVGALLHKTLHFTVLFVFLLWQIFLLCLFENQRASELLFIVRLEVLN